MKLKKVKFNIVFILVLSFNNYFILRKKPRVSQIGIRVKSYRNG
jgi:hypothetical protein